MGMQIGRGETKNRREKNVQRQISAEQKAKNWWAAGDTPVHTNDSCVTYLVDGRTAMLEMCLHFLKAKHYIYLADWGLTASMPIVRGSDHRAGPDRSAEQEALLAMLRAEGLQEADITFWCTNELCQAQRGGGEDPGLERSTAYRDL